MTLVYLIAAWVAGIFLVPDASPTGAWLILAGGSSVMAYWSREHRPQRLLWVCAAMFALGGARYAWAAQPLAENHIGRYADTGYVTLTGMITRDADPREKHTNLHIQAETVTLDDITQATRGLVLVQAPRYGDYAYGDRVQVSGTLLTPPEFDDFSYRDYLARQGIHAMIPNAQVETLERDAGRPWLAVMYDLKARAQRTINRLLPSPQAPLLSGILLGRESDISADIREAFNRTGTSHVIAISGANIIVVIRVLMGLLQPSLGKRKAGIVAMTGVGFYALFVGGDPAVIRAAIMGGMMVLAAQTGRRAHGLTTLAFAIGVMTLWNPLVLWDIGFQLSVAATAGLIAFSDTFTDRLNHLLQRGFAQDTARQITRWLSEPLVVGLAAQITTTPLILLYFGRFSLASFVANLLIVPVQAYIMTLGWLAVLMGMILPALGEPLAWVVWIPLTFTIDVVRALSKFDWASFAFTLESSYAWLIYAALAGVVMLKFMHPEDRAVLFDRIQQRFTFATVVIAGAVLSILVWVMALDQPDGKLHVWFFDIGHGHAVLIQTPNGAQILIDGGPNPTQLRRAVGDALPYQDRDLDLLIVTQPKTDSINALPAIFDRYDVGLVLTNGQSDDSEAYHALEASWQIHQTPVKTVLAGYQVTTDDGVTLEFLHPQTPPDADTHPDDAPLVIRASYGDTSFLLAPDVDPGAAQTILDAGWYAGSTVLELPSHGSAKTNTAGFLQAVGPQAAVVTVGAGNRSGLPDETVIQNLKTFTDIAPYRTDQHGTIEMLTDGSTLWVYTGR